MFFVEPITQFSYMQKISGFFKYEDNKNSISLKSKSFFLMI